MLFNRNPDAHPQRRRRFLIAPLVLALAIAAFQYFSAETFINPETGKAVRVALSPAQEEQLGIQSFREVLSQSRTITSGNEYEYVRSVVSRLIPHVDEQAKAFNWAVSLIKSDQINAFCLPGGKIAVFTGILPVAQNEDGLATVLGHEIAHATARHGSQRVFQQGIMQTVLGGIQGSLGDMEVGQRQLLLGLLGAGAQYGVLLPFNREHELEADELGLRYMVRAGFNPEQAIAFWERMAETSRGAHPPEFASTHPSHGSRIARIRELIDSGELQ